MDPTNDEKLSASDLFFAEGGGSQSPIWQLGWGLLDIIAYCTHYLLPFPKFSVDTDGYFRVDLDVAEEIDGDSYGQKTRKTLFDHGWQRELGDDGITRFVYPLPKAIDNS